MNIVEAIKSGKKFHRKGGLDWYLPFINREDIDISDITYRDILADDWEVKDDCTHNWQIQKTCTTCGEVFGRE